MSGPDSYLTINNGSQTEIKINKSRFISCAFHIDNKDEAANYILQLRKNYHDARHQPFAYNLFHENYFRYSDDGEPSGSSGKPIYDAILKYNLTNVLVVVIRYFGGIKLGVGGLKRAYFEAADECLKIASIKEIILKEKIIVSFDYNLISPVMNYLEKNGFEIVENLSAEKVKLICNVRLSKISDFKNSLFELTNSKISF